MRRPRAKPPLSTKRARTFLFWRREGRQRRLLRSPEPRSYLRPARALAKYGRASEANGVEAHTDGSNPSRSATDRHKGLKNKSIYSGISYSPTDCPTLRSLSTSEGRRRSDASRSPLLARPQDLPARLALGSAKASDHYAGRPRGRRSRAVLIHEGHREGDRGRSTKGHREADRGRSMQQIAEAIETGRRRASPRRSRRSAIGP